MSAISQKSISGITSITSPAGTDDQISLHTSNTNEALKIDGAGNLHLNNHVNTTGVSTASNFKTGSSNLHSTGLNVGNTFVHSTGINGSSADIDDFISVGSNIHLGNAGVITATSYRGDGSQLTGISQVGGASTVSFNNNVPIYLGDNNDYKIYFNNSKMSFEPTHSGTQQFEMVSNNQMYIHAKASGLFLRASNQEVISIYGGSGGGVYFRHNNTQKLKLEGGNWTYQGSPTVTFDGNILASSDSAIDIGTNSVRFANIYADTLYGDGSNLTNVSASFTTDAQFNLVAGEDAGSNFSGTSAEKNILLGHDAGKRITTGDNNIAIGDEAMAASDGGNITGSGNIAIGRQAMKQKAVTGDCNIIIGDNRAGRLLTSGSHNIGMG